MSDKLTPQSENPWETYAANYWRTVLVPYLVKLTIRKAICAGCGMATLYNKDGQWYEVTRNMTLDQVKEIVQQIETFNNATAPTESEPVRDILPE